MYNSLKAQVEKEEQEEKDIRNTERVSLGLPLGKA